MGQCGLVSFTNPLAAGSEAGNLSSVDPDRTLFILLYGDPDNYFFPVKLATALNPPSKIFKQTMQMFNFNAVPSRSFPQHIITKN